MKKLSKILIILSLYSCSSYTSSSSGDHLVRIQLIDRNGLSETISNRERIDKYKNRNFEEYQPFQQVTRIFSQNKKNGKVPSIITSYFPNGQISKYLESLDNRACGTYKEWHENGTLKIKAKVIGGIADLTPESQETWLFDGYSLVWNEKEQLVAKIQYQKGYLQGPTIYYRSNGAVKKSAFYQKGFLHGKLKIFGTGGNLISVRNYKKGTLHGTAIGYWDNRAIQFLEEYSENKLITGCYYDINQKKVGEIQKGKGLKVIFKDSKLFQTLEFIAGKIDGKVRTFSNHGFCVQEHFIKNGQKTGKETQYYTPEQLILSSDSPQPKLEIYWNKGVIHGIVKSWYNNGNLESQKEYTNNKKMGTCSCWYINGSLMLTEEYENDFLKEGVYFKKDCSDPVSQVHEGSGIATLFDKDGIFQKRIPYEKSKIID